MTKSTRVPGLRPARKAPVRRPGAERGTLAFVTHVAPPRSVGAVPAGTSPGEDYAPELADALDALDRAPSEHTAHSAADAMAWLRRKA